MAAKVLFGVVAAVCLVVSASAAASAPPAQPGATPAWDQAVHTTITYVGVRPADSGAIGGRPLVWQSPCCLHEMYTPVKRYMIRMY